MFADKFYTSFLSVPHLGMLRRNPGCSFLWLPEKLNHAQVPVCRNTHHGPPTNHYKNPKPVFFLHFLKSCSPPETFIMKVINFLQPLCVASSVLTSKLNFTRGPILLLQSTNHTQYIGIKETYSQGAGPPAAVGQTEVTVGGRHSPKVF